MTHRDTKPAKILRLVQPSRSPCLFAQPGVCACRCTAAEPSCGHVWDGPEWIDPDGGASVTCSLCGVPQMMHDLRVMP